MKKISILGKSIPAAILALAVISTAGFAILTVYITISGSATVTQSVTLNAIESTFKYDLVSYEEFEDPGVTSFQLPHFDAVGGDEQDVWLKLSNYAEINAPIELEKVVSREGSYNTCLDDVVTFYKPDVVGVDLCYKDQASDWTCYEEGYPEGTVYYTVRGPVLTLDVYLQGLDPNIQYQIALNGRNALAGNTIIGNNCPNPNAPASGFYVAWECGMWGDEGYFNFEMEATPEDDGTYYGHYQIPLGELSFDDVLYFEHVGIIVKYAGENARAYGGPWNPVAMEKDYVNFYITQVCGGEILTSDCTGGVSSTTTTLPARPFVQDPSKPSETWYCVRNAFDLAATPGTYDFTINVNPAEQ